MSNTPAIRARLTTRTGVELVVRALRGGDAVRLQRFNAGLDAMSRRCFLPHAYDDATVARMIARAEAGTDLTWVALASDEVAAYFFLWDIADTVPVLGIGIANAWQNQGLGRQLMEILIEDARRAGRDGIDLTTMLDNDRAFALYEKMGFRYIEDVDNVTGDGSIVTERWMFLPLKPGAQPSPRAHRPPA